MQKKTLKEAIDEIIRDAMEYGCGEDDDYPQQYWHAEVYADVLLLLADAQRRLFVFYDNSTWGGDEGEIESIAAEIARAMRLCAHRMRESVEYMADHIKRLEKERKEAKEKESGNAVS